MVRLSRVRRLAGSVTVSAVALAVLPATPAFAADPATPHLDAVEQTLRQVSPGLEGDVWERTTGNKLDGSAGDPSDWLLQTPAAGVTTSAPTAPAPSGCSRR
ncbi:hypothetical protein ACQEVX_03510 [Streptomyces syringium]|uniref:hypothetical protein n=1 Tax=Streptomyces syringium TaxID=76729 RepID=UPI003D8B7017